MPKIKNKISLSLDIILTLFFRIVFVFFDLLYYRDKKNYVVFGSKHGKVGNSYSLYLYLKSIDELSERAIWIDDLSEDSVAKTSWLKFVTMLHASHVIYSHSLRDVFYSSGFKVKKVNLWHGSPIKKILNDNAKDMSAKQRLSWVLRGDDPRNADFFVVGGDRFSDVIKGATGLKQDKLVLSGNPCTIDLTKVTEDEIKIDSKKYVVFFPTFRDNGTSLTEDMLIKIKDSWEKLYLERGICLIIKPHPNESGIADKLSHLNNQWFKILDPSINPYSILYNSLAIITDYSSIVFDAIVLGKKAFILSDSIEDCDDERGGTYIQLSELKDIPGIIVTGSLSGVISSMISVEFASISCTNNSYIYGIPFDFDFFSKKVGL